MRQRSQVSGEDDGRRPRRNRPLPPTYLVVSLAVMTALHLMFPLIKLITSSWRYLGVVPLVLGVVLNLWADRLFKKYGTEVKPFRDSSALVAEGPFLISRNPMYLGGMLILAGGAVLFGSITPFAVIPIAFWLTTAHFIIPEERDLERQFGEAYRDYRRRVHRWL